MIYSTSYTGPFGEIHLASDGTFLTELTTPTEYRRLHPGQHTIIVMRSSEPRHALQQVVKSPSMIPSRSIHRLTLSMDAGLCRLSAHPGTNNACIVSQPFDHGRIHGG